MTISVYKNMIYRKQIEDKHVVKLRGTQMVGTLKRLQQTFSRNILLISYYIIY